MNTYEKAIIFTSFMTKEEIINNDYVDITEELSFYAQGHWNETHFLYKARSKIANKLNNIERTKIWAGPIELKKRNISEIPFFETDLYKERYSLFVQHIKDMSCPICNSSLWLNVMKGYVSCRAFPNCKFTINRRVYDEIQKELNFQK